MEPSKPSARRTAAAVAEATPPPMSRMSVSRSARGAARYRPPAGLRGTLGLAPRRTNAALRRGPALVAAGAELVLDEVAGLAGEDRELEHDGPFGGGGQCGAGPVDARTTRRHGSRTESDGRA